MAHAGSSARLFVAIDPPAQACRRLVWWARNALRELGPWPAGPGSVRVLDPELAHLTLCFLGDRPVEQIAEIAAILERCATSVGELSVGAPLWLPARRPRVLAVEVHEDERRGLDRLRRVLCRELAAICELESERRRFRAHVTVARMRAAAAPRERTLPPTPALSFSPRTLVLYRSWLSPQGPSYEPLSQVELF